MWLCYVDESGNTGRKLGDPDQPIHWMTAVLVPENQVLALNRAVLHLLTRFNVRWRGGFPDSGRSQLREFHGAALFGGNGFWDGVTPKDRIDVYREAVSLIGQHDCVVAHSSVNKIRLAKTGQTENGNPYPHAYAFQFLLQEIETFLRQQDDPLRQRGLIVADQTQEHEVFCLIIQDGMQFGQGGVLVPWSFLTGIVDTPHFVRSTDSRGVQIADLVAFALNRSHRRTDGRRDRALKPESRVVCAYTWGCG